MLSYWTFHGGRLSEARAVYGDGEAPWLDLSTGINPNPWPGAAVAIDWRALPDMHALADLEAAAAACFGVDPAHLCALPGTEIGLRMLGDILRGPAAHVAPSYRTHAEIFPDSRAMLAEDLSAALGSSVILANPNNPDGRLLPPESLIERLDRMSRSPNWLVIDEAFADAVPEASLAVQVRDEQRLIIFRSFGKFFGLAGVRLGFVLGPRPLIARFRAKLGSWPVSAAAIAIGAAAYRDTGWIAAMRQALQEKAAALDAVLLGGGFVPIGACPLFRLIETDSAALLFERLARRAILTRPFDHDPRWLRIGLPANHDDLARLERALGRG
jgi:cobalamin biosynthetic protein CobC